MIFFLILTAVFIPAQVLLVIMEIRQKRPPVLFLKPLCSACLLLLVLSVLQFQDFNFQLFILLFCGMLLSFAGDILMIKRNEVLRAFQISLVLFLLTHIIYSIAFILQSGFHWQDLISLPFLAIVALVFYLLSRKKLGKMKIPVIIYMIIICFMVNRAISTFSSNSIIFEQALSISLGAIFFFASDFVLAFDRYVKKLKYDRISLFFYYCGQGLILISPAIPFLLNK